MDTASPPLLLQFPKCDAHPVRGVRWVLAWAAAVFVLGWAAAVLTAFAYQLAAEQTLSQAVAAALREAVCERATSHSVEQTIRRRLAERGISTQHVAIATQHNGAPLSGTVRSRSGDRLAVSLSVPVESVLPAWLHTVGCVGQGRAINVWADQTVGDI